MKELNIEEVEVVSGGKARLDPPIDLHLPYKNPQLDCDLPAIIPFGHIEVAYYW